MAEKYGEVVFWKEKIGKMRGTHPTLATSFDAILKICYNQKNS
jgi:hypothetical protein